MKLSALIFHDEGLSGKKTETMISLQISKFNYIFAIPTGLFVFQDIRRDRKKNTTIQFIHFIAGIAQLVEHDLAKVGVAGSSPVFRSKQKPSWQFS